MNKINIGRNDKCPCGSGKKYKHCCIDNEEMISFKKQVNEIPDQYSGYAKEIDDILELDNEPESICLVSMIRDKDDVAELKKKNDMIFSTGEWVLSTGSCDDIKIYGPFKDYLTAFEYGEKNYGVKVWV